MLLSALLQILRTRKFLQYTLFILDIEYPIYRGAKHRRQYELSSGISLLSLA